MTEQKYWLDIHSKIEAIPVWHLISIPLRSFIELIAKSFPRNTIAVCLLWSSMTLTSLLCLRRECLLRWQTNTIMSMTFISRQPVASDVNMSVAEGGHREQGHGLSGLWVASLHFVPQFATLSAEESPVVANRFHFSWIASRRSTKYHALSFPWPSS